MSIRVFSQAEVMLSDGTIDPAYVWDDYYEGFVLRDAPGPLDDADDDLAEDEYDLRFGDNEDEYDDEDEFDDEYDEDEFDDEFDDEEACLRKAELIIGAADCIE